MVHGCGGTRARVETMLRSKVAVARSEKVEAAGHGPGCWGTGASGTAGGANGGAVY